MASKPSESNITTIDYLTALYGNCDGDEDIILSKEPNIFTQRFKTNQLEQAAKFIESAKTQMFIKVNPMDYAKIIKRNPNGVGGANEVACIVSFHSDVDAGKSDKYLSRESMLAVINEMPHPPSFIVSTNGDTGGFHAYWLLRIPYRFKDEADRKRVAAISKAWLKRMREIAERFASVREDGTKGEVDHTADLCRYLRPIGSLRPQTGNHVEAYHWHPERRYELDDFILEDFPESLPTASYTPTNEQDKVIERYLRKIGITAPEQYLLSQGYKPFDGKAGFYIRPGGNSGMPTGELYTAHGVKGFTIKSGGAELPPGWYSMVGLFVGFEHGDDYKRAAAFCHQQIEDQLPKVDISHIENHDAKLEHETKRTEQPDELFNVPGFINEVIELSMTTAPNPNRPLSFCGALALLSILVARKIIFHGLAPNIYVLALAYSGLGKEHPRKLNKQLLGEAGLSQHVGDSFASGEGIEDTLATANSLLFQPDEFDKILQSMADEKESRFASITDRMLQFFTSATTTYYCRAKAKKDEPRIVIHRPHLSLLATCVPSSFYSSLSSKLMTGGLMARMLVVEGKMERATRDYVPIVPTESIVMQVEHYRDLPCGDGNLAKITPTPHELPATEAAKVALRHARKHADAKWNECCRKQDEGGMAVWARCFEHTAKLSMLYAASSKPFDMQVEVEAVDWARRFVDSQIQRMLKAVEEGMHESPFDKLVSRLRKKVASTKGGIPHGDLLKFSKVSSKDFTQAAGTLIERGEIQRVELKTPTRSKLVYIVSSN